MPRFSLILFFFCYTCLCGQSNARLLKQAKDAFVQHDWINAARLYEKLLLRDSSRLDWHYEYARILFYLYDLEHALRHFNIVVLADPKKNFPLAYFFKARILQSSANYKEAIKCYKKFLSIKKKNIPEYYREFSSQQIIGCENAMLSSSIKPRFAVEHIDTSVNSPLSEYAPLERDSVLYFSSLRNKTRKYEEDLHVNKIYYADFHKRPLTVHSLDTTLNSPSSHNGNLTFIPGTDFVLFTRCRSVSPSEYRCEIWKAIKRGNRFVNPEKLALPLNQPGYSYTHPHFCYIDGKPYLFFSSDMPGGSGRLDIWKSRCISLQELLFEPPENVPLVNTPDDDVTPWFDTIYQRLYFSSSFHPGFGGFDIFYSPFNGKNFDQPVNSGWPVNSSHNDVYFSINNSHTYAYFSSNRNGARFENSQNCCNDIFRIPIEKPRKDSTPPSAVKTDSINYFKEKMKLLVPITLYFHNDEPDQKTTRTITNKSYDQTYEAYIKRMEEYKNEYAFGLSNREKEIAIGRIEEFFSDSVEAGYKDLFKFSEMLEKILFHSRDTVFITIKGYCSPLASTEYNINLAKRRIVSLKNFFERYKNGIFLPYLNGTAPNDSRILYMDVDIGELPDSKVSDDLKDKKNSVYSPFAARERKIQILAIKFSEKQNQVQN